MSKARHLKTVKADHKGKYLAWLKIDLRYLRIIILYDSVIQ